MMQECAIHSGFQGGFLRSIDLINDGIRTVTETILRDADPKAASLRFVRTKDKLSHMRRHRSPDNHIRVICAVLIDLTTLFIQQFEPGIRDRQKVQISLDFFWVLTTLVFIQLYFLRYFRRKRKELMGNREIVCIIPSTSYSQEIYRLIEKHLAYA